MKKEEKNCLCLSLSEKELFVNKIKNYKYINMNNPLIKNNKTWLFNDLQDRTSHYNKILCAKSLYNS